MFHEPIEYTRTLLLIDGSSWTAWATSVMLPQTSTQRGRASSTFARTQAEFTGPDRLFQQLDEEGDGVLVVKDAAVKLKEVPGVAKVAGRRSWNLRRPNQGSMNSIRGRPCEIKRPKCEHLMNRNCRKALELTFG